jgi:hypothetical protein
MAEMMKVTGLWANKAKDGKTYLSGRLGDMRVLIFPNNYKEAENHPSHIMYFAPIERQQDQGIDDFGEENQDADGLLGNTPAPQPRAQASGSGAQPARPQQAYRNTTSEPQYERGRVAMEDDDSEMLDDPFADDAPPARPAQRQRNDYNQPPANPRQRPGTGRNAGF